MFLTSKLLCFDVFPWWPVSLNARNPRETSDDQLGLAERPAFGDGRLVRTRTKQSQFLISSIHRSCFA